MRYGPQLIFLSVLCVVAGVLSPAPWPVLVLLLWTAAALLAVGVALVLRWPGVFMKQAHGGRHWLSVLALWPYGLLNTITFHVYRLAGRTPWHEVAPGLYLGRRLTNAEAATLQPDAVIDLTCEFAEPAALRRRDYLAMPVMDTAAPTPAQLREGVEWLTTRLPDGRVYVHCALGHGRSATLVAAWMIATGCCSSVDEAEAQLKAFRPAVGLHRPQRAALEAYRAELAQTSSRSEA